jgi:hypothetical protein
MSVFSSPNWGRLSVSCVVVRAKDYLLHVEGDSVPLPGGAVISAWQVYVLADYI